MAIEYLEVLDPLALELGGQFDHQFGIDLLGHDVQLLPENIHVHPVVSLREVMVVEQVALVSELDYLVGPGWELETWLETVEEQSLWVY